MGKRGKSLDKRTLRWRNLPDVWMDWRDGTLSFKDCLFMLGVLKGGPVRLAPPPTNVDRETMLCTIRIGHDTARRLTDLAEALNEPGPLALAGRLLDESLSSIWLPAPGASGERLLEAHGGLQCTGMVHTPEGWAYQAKTG